MGGFQILNFSIAVRRGACGQFSDLVKFSLGVKPPKILKILAPKNESDNKGCYQHQLFISHNPKALLSIPHSLSSFIIDLESLKYWSKILTGGLKYLKSGV